MARVSKEEYETRLAETESAMVKLRSSYRVEQHLSAKFKVEPRAVRKWMKEVRRRWRLNAAEVDKNAHRDDLAATLNEVLFQAMNRSIIVKNDDGTVVVDTNPHSPTFGKPIVKSNPDLQRVLHAVSQLRSLYGVDAEQKHRVTVSADVDNMPDLSKMNPAQTKAMEEWLKTVAPGGDLTALAGEWFTSDVPIGEATPTTEPSEDA